MKARLEKDVKSKDVVLFMKGTPDAPMCGFSRAAVQILQVQGVDFNKVNAFNVLEDPELRESIKEYSEWPTIPQIYIKGEFIGGCDILLNMHQSGDLEDLLVKEEIVPPEVQEDEKN
ncbi:Putative Glutaredoxin [Rhizopus microsporus]|nr:Putative Glutaredoxin [Rhizopus microsporus]